MQQGRILKNDWYHTDIIVSMKQLRLGDNEKVNKNLHGSGN